MEENKKNEEDVKHVKNIENVENVENLRVIPEICDLKHLAIDKSISEIKEDLKNIQVSILKELDKKQKYCKRDFGKDHENLKDKIICSVNSANNKIDSLFLQYNQLRKQLDGNGGAGLHENVRSIKKSIRWVWIILAIFIILELGGSYSGVTLESIKNRFFPQKENQKIEKNDEKYEKHYNLDEIPNIDMNIFDKE